MSAPTPEPAPVDLNALERLLTRATAGPWRVVLDDTESATTVWQVCTSPEHPADEPDFVHDCCADGGLHGEPFYTEADAELVAALRNAAPELIRMARALTSAGAALDADAPAEPAPVEQQYLIWSHHHKAWWGPDGRGYRNHIADAGRYALADTAQWLGRGCGCCKVPEVVIPAPPGASIDLIRYGRRQIKKATAERIEAGQVNRYATDGGDPR